MMYQDIFAYFINYCIYLRCIYLKLILFLKNALISLKNITILFRVYMKTTFYKINKYIK